MKEVYLIKVEANANNNKYYKMIPSSDSFTVEYGRVGSNCQRRSYSMHQWDTKYREKIKNGYIDQTHLFVQKAKETKSPYTDIAIESIKEIVDRLQRMAKQTIQSNYTVSSDNVTQTMIDEAQKHIDDLSSNTLSMKKFNEILMILFKTIPRKMKNVSNHLANKSDDFKKILEQEQDLLDVMRGQVVQHSQEDKDETEEKINETILESLGLRFEEVNDEDIKLIENLCANDTHKFIRGWKVTNLKNQQRFDEYLKNEKINKNKLLFHGTRSENVWSIINMGLVLRPNAVITGKMFGMGIYGSDDFDKSRGYTSISGSRWSNGSENTGFMLIMDTAYGKPYDVYSFDSQYYDLDEKELKKINPLYNCLHAHAGTGMLRKDEIVYYNQDALTVKYLIEIR